MVNKDLLQKTMDLINAKPETHDQNQWVVTDTHSPCGTTMCFAGHAAVLAGAEIPDPKKHSVSDWYVDKDGKYLNRNSYNNLKGRARDEATSVAFYARTALGLDYDQAEYLFGPDLSREDLEEAVQELIETGSLDRVESYYDDSCSCCDESWYDEDDDDE